MKRSSRPSPGFTLVELLVVIAIIGILVALLLPAVQAARAAARRTQCQNQLKQVGLALMNFHDAHGEFPASVNYDESRGDPSTARNHYKNWIVDILPYMEEQSLRDSFNLDIPLNSRLNSAARGAQIKGLLCPEDDPALQLTPYSGDGGNWGRGNYAANGCMGAFSSQWRVGVGAQGERWKSPLTRGVMGANVAASISDITDGTTHTILVSEVRVGIAPIDRRGTWALGGAGASSLWMHGSDDDNGVNICIPSADNIQNCDDIFAEVGEDAVVSSCMGCNRLGGDNSQAGPRSNHVGGVFACMADGSVQFISDFVETLTIWDLIPQAVGPGELGVWQRLNGSADGEVVSVGNI